MTIDLERRWRDQAACAGMDVDIFFPSQAMRRDPDARVPAKLQAAWDRAKQFCYQCPVRNKCARDHLGEPEGVWGGLDPQERKRARRVRSRHMREAPESSRARSQYGRMVHELRTNARLDFKSIARVLGIDEEVVHELYTWRLNKIEEEEERSKVAALPVEETEEEEEIIWPTAPPRTGGDMWVRYMGRVIREIGRAHV